MKKVRAFKILTQRLPDRKFKFVMAGGVRNDGDEKRADEVEQLSQELGIDHLISVERNITSERMMQLFKTAQVPISSIILQLFYSKLNTLGKNKLTGEFRPPYTLWKMSILASHALSSRPDWYLRKNQTKISKLSFIRTFKIGFFESYKRLLESSPWLIILLALGKISSFPIKMRPLDSWLMIWASLAKTWSKFLPSINRKELQ